MTYHTYNRAQVNGGKETIECSGERGGRGAAMMSYIQDTFNLVLFA
jgi:hypothetical protein